MLTRASAGPLSSGLSRSLAGVRQGFADLASPWGSFPSADGWTVPSEWSIADGQANAVAGASQNLTHAMSLVAGATYELTYTVVRTSGLVTVRFYGGTGVIGISRPASGTYTDTLVAVEGNNAVGFTKTAVFAGSVSKLSIKRVG